jgi:hypothetical protein
MARAVDLVTGTRYWAGADLPWFVPQTVVNAALRDLGFGEPTWHEREDPPPVDPRSDPQYSDDWTSWATATYLGAPQRYTLPGGIKWFVAEKGTSQTAPAPKASPATDANVAYAEQLLEVVNQALASGKPDLMLQAAAYFEERNMPTLASVLRDAAGNAKSARAKRLGLIATSVALVVATGAVVLYATRRTH